MIKKISAFLIVSLPFGAFAAIPDCEEGRRTLACLVYDAIDYLNLALYAMMAVAVVVFVYHIIKYFILPNDSRKDAGNYVLYSVIGFFVILSIWGIVNIVGNTFGLDTDSPQTWDQISNVFPQ